MQENLLQQGFELMLYGMVFVFSFLLVLIAVMSLVSSIVVRWFPEPEQPVIAARPRAVINTAAKGLPDAQTLAAIKSAIAQHRTRD